MTNTTTSITKTLFRITYPEPTETKTMFLRVPPGSRSHDGSSTTKFVHEAYSASNLTIAQIIDILEASTKELGDRGTIDLVEVTVDTTINIIDTSVDDFLAIRRQKALEKLTLADVQALGLEKLAIYGKLRYHKVDDDDK